MRKNLTMLSMLWMTMMTIGSSAVGAINVTGGTLNAFVQQGSFIAAPADQPFMAPMTSISAMLGPVFPDGTAKETVSFLTGQAAISAATFWNGGTSVTSGNLSLTEDSSETLWLHVNSGTVGPYYQGLISLDAVGGGNLLSIGFGASNYLPQFDYYIPVTPGNYTLTWSDTGRIVAGQSGGGGFDATMGVPEPSSLAALVIAAAWFVGRRRRRT